MDDRPTLNEDAQPELMALAARERAEALLEKLRQAKADAEADQERLGKLSAEELAQGRQAMDNAITAAERMLEALNAAIEAARRESETNSDPPA
jgi:hypothetical protein